MVLESDAQDVEQLALPASIQALLAARLDSLEPGERRTLERASVVGKEFWQRAVADLSSPAERPQVTTRLLSLSRKGLLSPVREDGATADTFRFHHALIRDVAYAGIPKAIRADLHEGFANWLQSQPAGFGEHDEIVGYHAEQAYRYLAALAPGDQRVHALSRQASRLLGGAGRRAFARDDMRAASNLLGRAVDLMAPDDPDRGELQFQLSGAAWSTGDRVRADEALEAVVRAATDEGDTRLAWHALLERAARRGFAHDAEADELLAVAEEARGVFTAAGDSLGLARAWRRIGFVHRLRGQFGLAVEAGEEALVHAIRAADGREEGRIVDGLCSALLYGPMPAPAAIERCHELLAGARDKPSVEAAVLSSLAGLVALRGDFDEARRRYRRAKRLWEELGLRFAVAGLTQVGGEIELLAHEPAAAEQELRTGAEILSAVGGNALQSALLAKALAAQGEEAEADDLAHEAETAAGGHEIQAAVIAAATRASVAARRGDPGTAVHIAEAAVTRAERSDAPNLRGDALVVLATCLAELGRSSESDARKAEAREQYALKGNVAGLERLDGYEVAGLPSAATAEYGRRGDHPEKEMG